MMDLPAPAPMYCNVIDVASEQERVGPLLKLTISDTEKDNPSISVVAVFERMDCDGVETDPLTVVGKLIPQNSASTRKALVSLTEQPEVVAQWIMEEGHFHSDPKAIQLAIVEDLAANLDDTLLPPENNLFKISFKTGIVDQMLCFAFVADPANV